MTMGMSKRSPATVIAVTLGGGMGLLIGVALAWYTRDPLFVLVGLLAGIGVGLAVDAD
jgi:hypothetical protein